MSRKKKLSKNNGYGLSFYFGLAIMITIAYLFGSRLVSGERINWQLASTQTSVAVATINNEKAFFGNSPVSRQFYYRYYFKIDGIKYLGDSHNPNKMPGDTLSVRYYIPDPNINEPARK